MAFMGVLMPLIFGTIIGYFWYGVEAIGTAKFFQAVFIGVIMTATSVSITVQTLKELGKVDTELGTTIVSAAIVDDVIGIMVLSIVLGAAGGSDEPIGMVILKTVLFFVASGCFGFLLYKLFSWIDKRWPHRRRIVILSIVFCFALSYVAEKVFGVAEITGAFIAGVILVILKILSMLTGVSISVRICFRSVVFASIGLKTDLSSMTFGLLAFSGLFIVAAIAGKIVGCGFAAKVTKHTWKESLIAGVGMMTRGEVALVVTQKGLDSGLVKPEYFAPVILLIIVSSVITPILLKLLFSDKKQKVEVS